MKRLPALALAGAFLLAGCSAEAKPETFIAGDSLCVGLAQAAGIKSHARVGASTREVVGQLKKIPEGSTVIACFTTNDMPARLIGLLPAIDDLLQVAKERRLRLIVVGPINTPLWWDPYSAITDRLLSLQFIEFVSLRRQWNAGEHDGQFHLTSKGYARIWAIVKEKL
jgi:hypothetical protein